MSELINRYDHLKEATALAVKESESFEGLMDDALTKVLIATIRRYQDKLAAGVEDSLSDLLDTFKQKVTEEIFTTASTWKVANREPVLFPQGCRFAYTRGSGTIFIIEQSPGVRSLSFNECVIGETFDESDSDAARRLSLAMPYVVFFVHFKHGNMTGLYCGWRTSPLHSLNDMLSRPVLPNIHDQLNVCMDLVNGSGQSMSEVAESTVSSFWNSRFNNDVSDRWWAKGAIDERMTSALRWQEESENNSLWILGAQLGESKSVQNVVDLLTMHEEEPDEHQFRHKLSEEIDGCVKTLFHKVHRYFKKTKFDKYYPKDVTDEMKDAIIEASGELTDVVFALDKEIYELGKELHQEDNQFVRSGQFWTDYSP